MAKKERYPDGFYRPSAGATGELEGSGHADSELSGSEDSSMPVMKCISLNADHFSVPTQVLPLSRMSMMEKKILVIRLRADLEKICIFQKRVDSFRIQGATLSSSSDILSCSTSQNGPPVLTSKKEKESSGAHRARGWNRGSSGKFESAKQASVPATSITMIMKQCETLLRRLMSHEYGWVFNKPVDVVKLNLPDYLTIIKHPMDLGTVKRKLSSGVYNSPHDFVADVRLAFSNAMTYNPPGNDVHTMARTLSQFFEVRWKPIEKKLPPIQAEVLPVKSGPFQEVKSPELMTPSKKRKTSSTQQVVMKEPLVKVTADEKNRLRTELESFVGDLPDSIIEFLKENCAGGIDTAEDEIEIDLDVLSDDTLYKMRKLLDECYQERQRNENKMGEPCEIELLHGSGLSNSSIQAGKGGEPIDEDIDIEGSEPPVSSYCSAEVNNELGRGSSKFRGPNGSCGKSESMSELDQVEQNPQPKSKSFDSNGPQNGKNVSNEGQISSEKLYRAALLKSRFADTILKAREKTLSQVDKGDPEKIRLEKEQLEKQQRKERARLQAEAKAAEEARRQAEAEAAAEAKRQRELERAAAREALLQMEKTVEINENSRILRDLEMLRAVPGEHLPSSADETSPEHSQEALCGFQFGGSNPLEQLGLFRRDEEEDDDADADADADAEPPSIVNQANDIEEGEID